MHLSSKLHLTMGKSCQSSPDVFRKMILRVCITRGSLAAFFPSLSSPTTVSCCELPLGHPHLYPRWHLHTQEAFQTPFGDPPSGTQKVIHCSHYAQGSSPKSICLARLPHHFILLLLPHDALGGRANLESQLLLKAPFWNEWTQVLPAPGPTLNSYGFYSSTSFPGAQPSEW